MIDRIVIHSDNTATIVYDNRGPMKVTGDGKSPIITFLRWVLTEKVSIEYKEFEQAINMESEDTQVCKVS